MVLNSAHTYEYFVILETEFTLVAKQVEQTFIICLSLHVSFPLFFNLGRKKIPIKNWEKVAQCVFEFRAPQFVALHFKENRYYSLFIPLWLDRDCFLSSFVQKQKASGNTLCWNQLAGKERNYAFNNLPDAWQRMPSLICGVIFLNYWAVPKNEMLKWAESFRQKM